MVAVIGWSKSLQPARRCHRWYWHKLLLLLLISVTIGDFKKKTLEKKQINLNIYNNVVDSGEWKAIVVSPNQNNRGQDSFSPAR